MCASKWGLTFNQGAFSTYSKRPFTGTLSLSISRRRAAVFGIMFATRPPACCVYSFP